MSREERGDGVPTLVISGTIGSGKTAIATDIGEVLAEQGRTGAVIDLDWLGWVCGPPGERSGDVEGLILKNLAAVWPNFRDAGAEYLVLSRVIQSTSQLDALRQAIPQARLTVVRLVGSPETIAERLRRRDTGTILEEHLRETVDFDAVLERAALEDYRVVNDDRSAREVTLEILDTIGW
jgi:hypothetical protein